MLPIYCKFVTSKLNQLLLWILLWVKPYKLVLVYKNYPFCRERKVFFYKKGVASLCFIGGSRACNDKRSTYIFFTYFLDIFVITSCFSINYPNLFILKIIILHFKNKDFFSGKFYYKLVLGYLINNKNPIILFIVFKY